MPQSPPWWSPRSWWDADRWKPPEKPDEDAQAERVNYAFVRKFYPGVDPSGLTWQQWKTLLEGVTWNQRIEKGEHPLGSWIERNSIPGTIKKLI